MNDHQTPEPDDVEPTLRLDDSASGAPAVQPGSGPAGPPPVGPPPVGPPPVGPPRVGPPPVGPPPYAGYGYGQPPVAEPATKGRSGRIWPGVAALALIIGLIGGALGAVGVDQWNDRNQDEGRTSEGLSGVKTRTTAPLAADNGSIAAVAQELLPSTVQILADLDGEELGATGSGFILDEEGHIVTNNHVVEDADASDGNIKVVDHTGKRYDATVVGRSPVYDLAVLFVKDLPDPQPAALGSSTDLMVGEGVVAIGSPLGLSSTVTSGIVSALDRPVTTASDKEDLASYINAVQTDAAINPGNSGGPLVNLEGEVVGVNSAIATTGGGLGQESGNIGVGFAIPIEQVKVTADQILENGEARYPIIGATVKSDGSGDGAHIDGVEKGGPAEKAGLAKGDVVNRLNDRIITDSPTLIVAIRSHLPGETVELTVLRDGKEQKLKVTLDSKVG